MEFMDPTLHKKTQKLVPLKKLSHPQYDFIKEMEIVSWKLTPQNFPHWK